LRQLASQLARRQSGSKLPHSIGRLRPLEKLNYEGRGWTLDVLNLVRSVGKKEFYLSDIYLRDEELARLHPKNLHVRDKIRQQLQRLRDLGFLEFLGGGMYRVKT
jgi:type II restriction enzyme